MLLTVNVLMNPPGERFGGKHLEAFIQEKENEDDPEEGDISFGPGYSILYPLSASRALITVDLCTPDLLFIFWASICIPVPLSPANMTTLMFDALDDFLTKMKEADCQFTVFPHNLAQYGTLTKLPCLIKEPEDHPIEVDDWIIYFPQAKPWFNGSYVYTTALIVCSMPLSKLLKEPGDWFKESKFGLWEATIQTEAPVW